MDEIWKDIKGFEGRYQISNFGSVRVLNHRNSGLHSIRKTQLEKNGSITITLFDGKKYYRKHVYQLMYDAFEKEGD